ncbi:hypothetical protein [Streptomyces sp. NPDC048272]|uniref:hypothetical protein n=1 Tax=Streptomyces sp. NPDC048272 TaxID=3154616 RepID=UPI0034406110
MSYLQALAEGRRHSTTLRTYASTIIRWLDSEGQPVCEADRQGIEQTITDLATHEALVDDYEPVKAARLTSASVDQMAAACDTTTVRGRRDLLVLALYHEAARHLALYLPPATPDTRVHQGALEMTLHPLDRAMPSVQIRLPARPYSPACPVAAYQAWMQDLRQAGVDGDGPLLRRVHQRGYIPGADRRPAGRPAADPARGLGLGERSVRLILRDLARAATLVPRQTWSEAALLSVTGHQAALNQASPQDRRRLDAHFHVRRRGIQRSQPRITTLSLMRRVDTASGLAPSDLLRLSQLRLHVFDFLFQAADIVPDESAHG